MSQIGKLYKYYLKKSLWRSWRVWYVILFCWVWWILWPIFFSHQVKNNLQIPKGLSGKQEEEARQFFSEEFGSFKNLVGTSYAGAHLVDKENAEWWEKQADKATDTEKKNVYKGISDDIKGWLAKNKEDDPNSPEKGKEREISDEEKWLSKHHRPGVQYPLYMAKELEKTPFDYQYIALSSGRQQEVTTSQFWHLVNFVSLGNLGGIVLTIFLVYSLVDYLFIQPKKNGEEAGILVFCPSVQRSELFISKSLAYITALFCYSWLAFVLPYTIICLLGPGIVSWGAYLSLVFWTTIIGPILFFLFPISLYLFTSSLGVIGTVIYYLLSYFSLLWSLIKAMALLAAGKEGGGFWSTTLKMEYWYFHPYVYVPLAIVLGGLLLYLHHSYYQKEDLG